MFIFCSLKGGCRASSEPLVYLCMREVLSLFATWSKLLVLMLRGSQGSLFFLLLNCLNSFMYIVFVLSSLIKIQIY